MVPQQRKANDFHTAKEGTISYFTTCNIVLETTIRYTCRMESQAEYGKCAVHREINGH